MKELSIEEKAKAYDEAINVARTLLNTRCVEGTNGYFHRKDIEQMFPSLVENEDERIRKGLIDYFNYHRVGIFCGIKGEDIIAWLEKQGGQNPITFNDAHIIDSALNDYCCKQYGALHKENGGVLSFARLQHLAMDIYGWCKKQGEQKPADKVEPKFKVGDWIIHNKNTELANSLMLVTGKDNNKYLCKYKDGQCSYNIEFIDKEYRLWTIQDAKDGDVLHSTGFHSDCVFIFNGLDNWKFDEPNGDRAVATGYCGLFVSADNMEFGIQGPDCVEVDTIKPAAKIQRDLLFQKMKDTGYEWDAEKKELKKVEHIPAWSDEDEKQARQIERIVHDDGCTQKLQKQIADWFKSLKDRVLPQPKREWKLSEEEKAALRTAIHIMTEERSFPKLGTHLQNILNVFEGQSREEWKPSEEQMEILQYLCNTSSHPNEKVIPTLESLYNDLKKLREE